MLFAAFFLVVLQSPTQDRDILTRGVHELDPGGGAPGAMVASGDPAFVVVAAGKEGLRVPEFVAAHAGKGRVLAGGHDSFFEGAPLQKEGNRRFFLNALDWLAGKPLTEAHVGYLGTRPPQSLLAQAGATATQLSPESLSSWLPQGDVLFMDQGSLDGRPELQTKVVARVKAGAGLFVGGPAWGWQELSPGKSLLNYHSGNRMLGQFGIHFSPSFAGGPFTTYGAGDPELTTQGGLEALSHSGTDKAQLRTAIESVQQAIEVTPNGHSSFIDRIAALAGKESHDETIPTKAHPATWDTPFARLDAVLELRKWRTSDPSKVTKAACSEDFPGAIPVSAKRIDRQVEIDASTYGWHATGAYVPPGEVVTITIPDSVKHGGLSVRIGPQTDTLWDLDKWDRFPEISMEQPLDADRVRLATPFGGLIYVAVPENSKLGVFDVQIQNVVASPLYELGKTTQSAWLESRQSPAPWADLVGKHVSISLPRYAIEKLDDPEALMRYWDNVMANCCALYSVPVGGRQERYCVDREISAGYMHSGYPIMTWEDVAQRFADLPTLLSKKGLTWGFYHEMGHNFQQGDWTFEGTGEVTNNLFSVYGEEMINGITPDQYGNAHSALEAKAVHDRIAKYLADGAKFETWQSDPFLALSMYLELREEFGWQPFKDVFAEYRGLSDTERPKTEEQKHDQWMVRFSRHIHMNLGPFFVAWGVPTSEEARRSIAGMPAWMPKEWPGGI